MYSITGEGGDCGLFVGVVGAIGDDDDDFFRKCCMVGESQ